ncbi:hypothetical protein PT974_03483 [Cladobotryum mycophilum]|uniref:GDS1 winged helix domain-containing protein n=1 Tax=Cladobotryum mycophilum TaxID=491253 RepID=A0ABR0STL2_9HYPO
MPYNTRRKSLSLPSLGIHIPVTHAARAAAASRNAARPASSSSSSSSSRAESPESHPNKRIKRSHAAEPMIIEQTPPPSPTADVSDELPDVDSKIDFETINDDIVEAVVVQLQSTANRPHLVKELATVLTQTLTSVQQSANPCAIISSRLASYMKRACWTDLAPCPLAKELEAVHPRRTYYFLTTRPRQPLPDFNASQSISASIITPSVSLTDDSGSDDVEDRRRELSPSPEVDLSPAEFEDHADDDIIMPMTPIGSYSSHRSRVSLDPRNNSPPLEKDEREFTQTADGLQKRKLNVNEDIPAPDTVERNSIMMEFGYRDDVWFADSRPIPTATFLASPPIKPSTQFGVQKDDDANAWLRLNKLFEWDSKGAESIEIDELDCLLDAC